MVDRRKARLNAAMDKLLGASDTKPEGTPAQVTAQQPAQNSVPTQVQRPAQEQVQDGVQEQPQAQKHVPASNLPTPKEKQVRFHFWGPKSLKSWVADMAAERQVPEAEILRFALEWFKQNGPLGEGRGERGQL